MRSVRVAVEWGFGKIMNNFQHLNHEENLRLWLQPVGLYFPVANMLASPLAQKFAQEMAAPITVCLAPLQISLKLGVVQVNCHTCLYGSSTGDYFGVEPPELEDYLSGNMLP